MRMFRSLISCLMLLMLMNSLFGQMPEAGKPYSSALSALKSTAALPAVNLKKLDIDKLLQEEADFPGPFRYGLFTDTILNIKLQGKPDIIPSQGTIWRMRIASENAKSIQLIFNRFVLPDGASLFLYNENQATQAGAFSAKHMQPDSSLVIPDFPGNQVYLEYFEPDHADFPGELIIGSISQAFIDLKSVEVATGYININCPTGKNAQLPKHAVCNVSFRSGGYAASCSGALINNAKHDGTPYFLTANHCISRNSEASSVVAYFNYENVGCSGPELTPLSISGAVLLSTSSPSDYTLLRLNDTPPAVFQPYYAGWDARDTAVAMVTSIHHPQGLSKKISIDYDTLESNPVVIQWDNNAQSPVGSHWVAYFEEGTTAKGSSGAPLFNDKHQIIGQLHGGDESMELFGKLSYSYANKPAGYPGIQEFLDPDSTGIMILDGFSPANNIPDAFFTTGFTSVCISTPVAFQDYSAFGPYTRKWSVYPSILPEDFAFLNGTSDTSANPVIAFNKPQDYLVKLDLLVSDTVRSSESLPITANVTIEPVIETESVDPLCDCDFNRLTLHASGAVDFTWEISPADKDKAFLEDSLDATAILVRNAGFQSDSGYTVNLVAIGLHGTCSDTARVALDIIKPANDNIAHSVLLPYGKSKYYSNVCATAEEDEPIPPFTSCTAQDSWCDEYGTGEDIVENSVWFRFVASHTGRVSIASLGFDNQIALYEANSYPDILTGSYTLLAANDDRSKTDPTPLIKATTVIPGNTYWIQVDGSAGGAEGNFNLNIVEISVVGNSDLASSQPVIYPQPAEDIVFLANEHITASTVQLSIHSISGQCVFRHEVDVDHGLITLDIAGLDSGIYMVSFQTGEKAYFAKLIKR